MNNAVVSEGEELTARCIAPGETGSIIFYFYDDSKEILEDRVNSNQSEVKLRFNDVGIHKMNCSYTVLVTPFSFRSNKSNTVTVSVKGIGNIVIHSLFQPSRFSSYWLVLFPQSFPLHQFWRFPLIAISTKETDLTLCAP